MGCITYQILLQIHIERDKQNHGDKGCFGGGDWFVEIRIILYIAVFLVFAYEHHDLLNIWSNTVAESVSYVFHSRADSGFSSSHSGGKDASIKQPCTFCYVNNTVCNTLL